MLGISGQYQSETPGFAGQLISSLSGDGTVSFANGTTQKQTIAAITAVHGGTAAGVFTLTIGVDSPVTGVSTQVIAYSAASNATATVVADALVAAFNANSILNDVALASNVAGVITITILYPRQNPITSVAGTVTGSGNTLTASPTITNFAQEAKIPFGYAVGYYSSLGDHQCSRITTATGLTILGVAVRSLSVEAGFPYDPGEVTGYGATDSVNVLRKGRIYVPVAAAVTRQTQANVVASTGQFTTNGAGTAVPGSIYLTSAAAGGVAELEINLPA